MNRTKQDKIGAVALGFFGLIRRMGRIPNQFFRAKQSARGLDRQRSFAELNAGGVDHERDIDSVINKKLGVVTLTEQGDLIGDLEDLFTVEIFFSQLNRLNTAVQRPFKDGAKIAPPS